MYALVHNGKEVERHSTEWACQIAAIERGLVLIAKGKAFMADSASVVKVSEEEPKP